MNYILGDVLKDHIKVEANTELYNKIKIFRLSWAQKSDIYIEFLGNTLTGVHPIRFSSQDESILFNDILKCDKNILQEDIFKCKDINKKFKTISEATHISLYYIIHLFSISNLPKNIKIDAVKETYYILAYKMLSSILYHYFKYDLDISIAKSVYERLSGKFLLKQHDSWQSVLEHRANDLLPPNGLHSKRVLSIQAINVTKVIADLQGRLREIIKNIYAVLIEVIEQNERVTSTTLLTNNEDSNGIRDSINNQYEFINYLLNIYSRPNEFINSNIIDLICSMYNLIKAKHLDTILKYISLEYKDTEELIKTTMLLAIDIIAMKGYISNYKKDIVNISTLLKNYISAPNVKDKRVIDLKKKYDTIIKNSIGNVNKSLNTSLTFATMMYIFYRGIFNDI